MITAVVLGAVLLASGSARAASGLRWSAASIDQQASVDAGTIYALSCPVTTLCVAGDDEGNILTSTDPAGGRAAWASAAVDSARGGLPWINGLSCPSTGLCVGVDQSGEVLTSTDPTGGARAWNRLTLSNGTGLAAVACPTTTDCVAVGGTQAFSTTAPTGNAAGWAAQTIDAQNRLTSVSCPSTSFCAAADDEGNVLTSPGASGPWTITHLTSRALLAVSCTADALCVAADDDGSVWSSTTPAAGAAAWHRTVVTLAGGTRGVDCVDMSFCVTGNEGIRYSLNPGSEPPSWVAASAGAGFEANAISCAGSDFCAAAGGGDIAVSTSPTTGSWAPATQIDGAPTLFGVSCPSVNRCYAGDDSGHILTSMRPAGGPSTWTATGPPNGETGPGFYGLACPTGAFCVAGRDDAPIGSSGFGGSGALTSNPTGPVNQWKTIPLLHGPDPVVHGFFDAGCAGATLCAITWDNGDLSISTTPRNARSWRKLRPQHRHPGVYCPRTGRCVAPGGSCPTRHFCAVLRTVGDGTGNGQLTVSTNPYRGTRAGWKTLVIDAGRTLTAISCTSARQCFAVDTSGRILASSRPTAASSWRVAKTVPEPLQAISCPSIRLCVAVGQDGTAVTGVGGG